MLFMALWTEFPDCVDLLLAVGEVGDLVKRLFVRSE